MNENWKLDFGSISDCLINETKRIERLIKVDVDTFVTEGKNGNYKYPKMKTSSINKIQCVTHGSQAIYLHSTAVSSAVAAASAVAIVVVADNIAVLSFTVVTLHRGAHTAQTHRDTYTPMCMYK